MDDTRIWDYSTLDVFQTCRKKYYWQFIRHLQTRTKSPALLFGGALHDALDVYYVNGLPKAVEKFRETYKDIEGEEVRTIANGIKLLETYATVYAKEPFKVLGKPETGFVFPLTDTIMYGGRLDLPVEWDGALWIMEHKTTSRLDSNFFKQWDLDKQITGYVIATEEFFGRPCMGCVINALEPWKELKRPTEKSKKPEDHFCRATKNRTVFLKDRFRKNVTSIVRDILWCEANNEFYEAEKKDVCYYYNYDCPYAMLCRFGEDEKLIEREYVVEIWQPYKQVKEKLDAKTQ